jgi:hypothetical protein
MDLAFACKEILWRLMPQRDYIAVPLGGNRSRFGMLSKCAAGLFGVTRPLSARLCLGNLYPVSSGLFCRIQRAIG